VSNGAHTHRELQAGDLCNLDVSVYIGGFHADLNETFLVGDCDPESQALVRTAFECLAAAVELVKPGTMYRDLGTAIGHVAKQNKCSVSLPPYRLCI